MSNGSVKPFKPLEQIWPQKLYDRFNDLAEAHAVLRSCIQVLTEKVTAAESTIHTLQKQVAYLEDENEMNH